MYSNNRLQTRRINNFCWSIFLSILLPLGQYSGLLHALKHYVYTDTKHSSSQYHNKKDHSSRYSCELCSTFSAVDSVVTPHKNTYNCYENSIFTVVFSYFLPTLSTQIVTLRNKDPPFLSK
jgi:hypothetical protein